MDIRDQASLVAFNRALACVVAELVDSLEIQGFTRQEAVAIAAVWSAGYLKVMHTAPGHGTSDNQG